MNPLSVPMATVKFNTKIDNTSITPSVQALTVINVSTAGQHLGQGAHRELPKDRLSPG